MAQKVIVEIASDMSGVADAHKVDFGLDGINYEIDLTEDEHARLKGLLGEFVSNARKSTGAKRGRPAKASTTASTGGSGLSPDERKAVREFAAANGVELAARGRIAELAVTAWRTQNPEILTHLKAKQEAMA